LIFFFLSKANSNVISSAENELTNDDDDVYQDDEYDYGVDYDTKSSETSSPPDYPATDNIITNPPYFEHTEIEYHAKPGENVLLNCDVRNFQSKCF